MPVYLGASLITLSAGVRRRKAGGNWKREKPDEPLIHDLSQLMRQIGKGLGMVINPFFRQV
jgi:hypothetical protein